MQTVGTESAVRRAVRLMCLAWILCATVAAAAEPITLDGTVRAADGTPLPEAAVGLYRSATPYERALAFEAGEPEAAEIEVRSGRDGRFRLEVPHAGLFRVRVASPGFVAREIALEPLLQSAELPAVRLSPDVGVAVTVQDPEGTPIEGAHVALTVPRGTELVRFLAGSTPQWRDAPRSGSTGPDGVATLPRAENDDAHLLVAAAGRTNVTRRRISGTAMRVRLRAAEVAAVRVVGDDGSGARKPVADVALLDPSGGFPVAWTDDDGRATVALGGAGTRSVLVASPDGIEASRTVRAARAPDTPHEIALPEARRIAGRAVDADTRDGVAGAVVWPRSRPWAAAVTDRTGGYVLTLADGDRDDLVAGAPGYLRAPGHTVRADDEGRPGPTLPLEPGALVEGVVVDTSGEPIVGAAVSSSLKQRRSANNIRIAISAGGSGAPDAVTDARGRFRLGPIDADEAHTLRASAEGFATATTDVLDLQPRRTKRGVRLELSPGRTVVGRVVGPEGEPLSEAEVSFEPARQGGRMVFRMGPGGPPLAEHHGGTTDADGSFRIAGLDPGTYDITIRRRGYARFKQGGLEVPEADEATDVGEFSLVLGAQIQGYVIDPEGTPIEGVEISVREMADRSPHAMLAASVGAIGGTPDAITGPDGWFTVEDLLPEAEVELTFARSSYVRHQEPGVRAPRAEPVAITLRPASSLSGVVLDPEGQPIPGATVNLTRSVTAGGGGMVMKMMRREDTVADDVGAFRFENLEPGTVSLTVDAPGFQTANRDGIEIPKGEDVEGVEVRLEPGAVLIGRVTAPDGNPAIGAELRRAGESSEELAMFDGGATSDGSGYYRLEGLVPGTVSIAAAHDDYVRTVRDVELDPGVNHLDLQFEGGQPVDGVVTDGAGRGVPGATVRLLQSGRSWGGPETISGGDGGFRFEGVADGTWRLDASAEGFAPYRGEDPIEIAGSPVVGVVARLGAGAILTGSVQGVEERELADVQVEAAHLEGAAYASGNAASDGTFRLEDLAPGPYRVVARVGLSGRRATGEVTIEQGATSAHVDLRFGEGLTLRGRVTLSERPFASAMVIASGRGIASSAWGETDHEGAFRLEGLEPGTYEVDVRQWDTGISYRETVELDDDLEVEFEIPTATVTGRVVDAADRSPLSGVRVELASSSGRVDPLLGGRSGVSDLDGVFRVTNVPDGDWVLSAERKGFAAHTEPVTIREGRDLDGLKLALDPTEGLTLRLRGPTGMAPDSAQIAVLDGAGRSISAGRFSTGENGAVRLSTVPPGSWTVLVAAAGTAVTQVAAQAPGAALDVALPPATVLRVAIPELAGGADVATLTLTDDAGRRFRTLGFFADLTDTFPAASGQMTFGSLPPATWTVRATTADGRTWQGTVTTTAGSPADLVLE